MNIEKVTALLERTTPLLLLALGVLLSAITSTTAAIVSAYNAIAIQEVHTLTNSLAHRTEALARKAGLAEGELKGRQDEIDNQIRQELEQRNRR